MRTYYTLMQHLKTVFEDDDTVNTISTGEPRELDNYKKNIYPLVHLYVLDSPYNENTSITRYRVQVTAVDVRDINKEDVKDKFWFNDNRHDNWNAMRSVLKHAQIKLSKESLGEDIRLVTATDAEPLIFASTNALDGWQQTFTLDIPDDYTTSC